MLDFTPSQRRTIAAGITVVAVTVIGAFVLLLGWTMMRFLSFASSAIVPVVLGLFLAMLFKPYYNFLVRRLRNPTLSLLALFLSLALPLGLVVWFGGSMLVEQIMHFTRSAPTVVTRLSDWVNSQFPTAQSLLSQCGVQPDQLQMMFLTDPERFSRELVSELGSVYGADAVKVGVGAIKYLSVLGSILVSVLFFVYFLLRPDMRGTDCVRHLPFLKDETRSFVARQVDSFIDILVNFFRRQVIICLIEGVLYGTGFALVGLPYGFLLGFLLGVLNLVPLFGTVVCMPLAIPLAYFGDDGGMFCLIGVLAVWITGQFLDGYFITPKIQGDSTGLGYAGVIFSFFFWGVVFHSLLGLLLAIPLSAFCVVFWRAFRERYVRGVI